MTTLSIASFIAVRPSISPASRKRATPVRARLLCYESGGPAHRLKVEPDPCGISGETGRGASNIIIRTRMDAAAFAGQVASLPKSGQSGPALLAPTGVDQTVSASERGRVWQ